MIFKLLVMIRLSHLCMASHYEPLERFHNPKFFTTTMHPVVDAGTETVRLNTRWTPDFRLEEPMPEPWMETRFENHRPYRISPHKRITENFWSSDYAHMWGCYCTTVYRRYRVLAGCAVLTKKHILTSAAATEMVLRKHRRAPFLDNILGAWYDNNEKTYNSSMYMVPHRIHYHPLFTLPRNVNRTHPFPVMFDMALWTSMYSLYSSAVICNRGAPHKYDIASSTPTYGAQYQIFGFQFVRAYNRRPMPWFKYVINTECHYAVVPCPKTEWGWFQCFNVGRWAPLGLDIGSALHRRVKYERYWLYSGLIGLNTISMRLRSIEIIAYFNDANTHKALDFFYNAYNARIQCVYLDSRVIDSFKSLPQRKPGADAPKDYKHEFGREVYSSVHCCFEAKDRTGYDNSVPKEINPNIKKPAR